MSLMITNMSQAEAPLFEALQRYAAHPLRPFHTPGHKAGFGMEEDWNRINWPGMDLTEITAFAWQETLVKAETLAAEFFQADHSIFLVQGASQGIIGGMLGLFSPGDTILVGRNCHAAVIKGLVLGDLNPVYIPTDFPVGWNIPAGIDMDALRNALQEYPEAKGLIVTNPTYQGIGSRIGEMRESIGDRILFVDEAHGGHFGWAGHEGFDARGVADLWVHGTHKIFGSLTQTGMLHLRAGRVDISSVRQGLELLTTTSPSYILLASLDSNRRFLARIGHKLFLDKLPLILRLKKEIQETKGIELLEESLSGSAKTVDPWKITLKFPSPLTGYAVEKIMGQEFQIQVEYADLEQVTLFCAPWQNETDLEQLRQAIQSLSRGTDGIAPPILHPVPNDLPPLFLRPRVALTGPRRTLPLNRAVGHIAATLVAPYPPGVPLIGPGELIREEEIACIRENIARGGIIKGLTPEGELQVVENE